MMSCDQVRSQLLEHLYDLLEEEHVRALDDHLRGCDNCQTKLGHAREQMALIAAAAKEEFPKVHFVPPTDKTSEGFKAWGASGASRRWGIRWAAAAAILLAVVGVAAPASMYWRQESQITQADNNLRQAKDELAMVDAQRLRILDEAQRVRADFRQRLDEADKDVLLARNDLIQLGQDFQQKIQQTRSEVNAKQMDLTISGPRVMQPGAQNQFHIQTRSFRLQPMPARISVAVRDQDKRELFKKENLASRGDIVVSLPRDLPLKPDAALVLEVQARSEQNSQVVLSESLSLTEPLYVTHLTTDKTIYWPGETVRFRSLSLERYSLQPPTDDLELTFKITKPTGEMTTVLKCLAAARRAAGDQGAILGPDQKTIRGIGAGEFKIDMQTPAGQYTLMVSEAQQRFPPQELTFQVGRSDKYEPSPQFLGTDKLDVKFYPESGDLVAGVPNRVYFQVITEPKKLAQFKARIVDQSGKAIASVETFRDPSHRETSQGHGVFTFTPQADKEYQLKVDQPIGMEGKFILPAAKPDGVVLSIPSGVVTDNEPIKAVIRNVGADRSLLIGAYCRGRLMGQQSLAVRNGEVKEVTLGPDSGVGGVYRVTVFERAPDQTKGERLEPRTERLIYRSPTGRLRLSIQPDKPSYAPGERAHIRITATTETKQSRPAIAAVTVVDQANLKLGKEKALQSMPAYFLLANEIQRHEDLKSADYLLSGDPQASKALDLLLGIQGWRRFAEQDPDKFQKEHKELAQRLLAIEGQWPPRSVNYGQEAVQKVVKDFQNQYAALEKRLKQAEHSQVAAQNGDVHEAKIGLLRDQAREAESARTAAVTHAKEAQESLVSATDKFQRYRAFLGRIILPAMLIVFLLAAIANLALAIRRRSEGRAIPYLAAAASSLVLVTLALTQKANLLGDIAASSRTEIADLSDLPNDQWMAQIRLDERIRKPGPAQNELANRSGQPPLIGRVQPIAPPQLDSKDKKRPAEKQEQAAPQERRNLLPRLPAPPPSPPPFVAREYSRSSGENKERPGESDTLFWHPLLVLPDGSTEISFDLGETAYQVKVTAHTLDGRLAEEVIDIPVKKPGDH